MSYKVNDSSGGHGKSVLLVPCHHRTELQSSPCGEGVQRAQRRGESGCDRHKPKPRLKHMRKLTNSRVWNRWNPRSQTRVTEVVSYTRGQKHPVHGTSDSFSNFTFRVCGGASGS